MDGLRSLLHQRALRCRTCHVRFYGRPGQALAAKAASDAAKRARKFQGRGRRGARRRVVEAIIFALLLLLFWSFLKYLTREPAPSDTLRISPPNVAFPV